MIQHSSVKQLFLIVCFCFFTAVAFAQTPAQTFYYNPKGLSFIPALKKPSVIYDGRIFAGKKQLTALFNHLNNAEANLYFKKYKSNKTASTLITIAGYGLSIYSLIDWRTSSRKFNWYTFGGGLVLSGVSGYLDGKASQNLRYAVIAFDNATKKTTFVPEQPTITFTIPLVK